MNIVWKFSLRVNCDQDKSNYQDLHCVKAKALTTVIELYEYLKICGKFRPKLPTLAVNLNQATTTAAI